MSSTTFSTTTSRHARPTAGAMTRLRAGLAERRDAARSRRELEAILAGHHGRPMRDEISSVLSRG